MGNQWGIGGEYIFCGLGVFSTQLWQGAHVPMESGNALHDCSRGVVEAPPGRSEGIVDFWDAELL